MKAIHIAERIKARETSVEEVVLEALERAEADTCNAFITVCEREQVLVRAREVQARIDAGELADSPLAGVPIAVKDNICTKGVRTTCGSWMLENYVPTYSATVVEKLEQAGLILIGKTNMDEFGMGSTSETSFFGPVKNPYDETRVAGGSSGGSAAAVASGIVPLALGTDTGGSIRQPSSHCGVVGLKPTYGTVSRFGLVAYASSMDQIGPIAGNVEDCAALLDVITGYDPKDSTSLRLPDSACPGSKQPASGTEGIRIGIPRGFSKVNISSCEEFDLDYASYAVPAYYVIACAEASSNLARFDGVKYGFRADGYESLHDMYEKTRDEGFGEEVRRRIRLGEFVLSQGYYDEYYLQACRVRRLVAESYQKAFAAFDFIGSPVAPTVAPKLGESLQDPIRMYTSDLYTVPANLCGFPAISIPGGTEDGMPVGVMLTGNHFSERRLLQAAREGRRVL